MRALILAALILGTNATHVQAGIFNWLRPRNIRFVQVEKANQLVVVSAKGCAPCVRLEPIIKRLQEEGYDVTKVMIETYVGPEKVVGTPTLFFYKNGPLVETHLGFLDYDGIRGKLSK